MRTRVLLIFFILITSFSYNVNAENARVLSYKENIKIPSSTSWIKNVEVKKDKNNSKNKFKVTKKDLKTEIKQRKKYHKSLLSIYNEWFDPKYLELIQSNSNRLSSLRKLL